MNHRNSCLFIINLGGKNDPKKGTALVIYDDCNGQKLRYRWFFSDKGAGKCISYSCTTEQHSMDYISNVCIITTRVPQY